MSDKLKGQANRWSPSIGSQGQSGGPWRGSQDHLAYAHGGHVKAGEGDVPKNMASRTKANGVRSAPIHRHWGVPASTHRDDGAINNPLWANKDPAAYKAPRKHPKRSKGSVISSR